MSSALYERLAEIPVPLSGFFVDRDVIQLNSSIQDFTKNARRSVSKSIFLTSDTVLTSPNQEIADIVLSKLSKSGVYRAILKETGSDDKKKRFVEVWSREKILASKEVTDLHGVFYNDDHLSTLSFSISDHAVVYVAEEKNETPKDMPEYFRYSQSFGEGFPGKKRPAIFVFLWDQTGFEPGKNVVIRLVANTPDIFFGQALFSSNSDVLFATGYEHSLGGRLLGLRGCLNKPSGIWQITLEKDALSKAWAAEITPSSIDCKLLKLTPSNLSARSPRLVPSEGSGPERLLWLACPSGGAFASTSRLYSLKYNGFEASLSHGNAEVLVDVVDDSKDGAFPGFYPDVALPNSPFLRIRDHDYLISHSTLASCNVVLLISLVDGMVKNLTPTNSEGSPLCSWFVLNTDGERRVLCTRTSPTVPFEVVLGEFDDSANVSWKILQSSVPDLPAEIPIQLSQLKVSTVRHPERHPLETIVIQHTNLKAGEPKPPHIIMPHGGPHFTSLVGFNPTTVAFALAGFDISLPNYTGSLGFGEAHVQALLGKCGTLDVEDCMESFRHLARIGVAQEGGNSRVFLFGGSHGGFIIGHLLARYPETFAAACLRNPLLSLGEFGSTDLRDWFWGESKREYPLGLSSSPAGSDGLTPQANRSKPNDIGIMTPTFFESLYKSSPSAHIEKVKAAVLLCVGGSDRRASPTQSIDYYHALKAARAKASLPDDDVEMLLFPEDGHGLEGVEASKISWVRTVEWFKSRA
ncbi:hypothetical protein V5O48_013264 [Marasmius crinis-equi]|uniref:acylaminoacyl-peptidase n=1 Tax=Marasmius crinis-equi TaxID=585013 RepID=A0ABR3F0X0_9AGAR